jgi:hypothetical protein
MAMTCTWGAAAQEVRAMRPHGAMPGEELEITLYGRELDDLVGVLTFAPGLEFTVPKAENGERAKVKLRVAPDCALGRHTIMLQGERGLSRARTFHVGPLPTVREPREPHDAPIKAMPLTLDVSVEGTVREGEIDWFAVDLENGAECTVEVEGHRLADSDWDPRLMIFGPDGTSIADRDDSPLGRLDPMVTFAAAAAGRYTIALSDVTVGGSVSATYRLHVGAFPRPVVALDSVVPPGAATTIRMIDARGRVIVGAIEAQTIRGPRNVFPRIDDRVPPTPIHVLVDERPVHHEDAVVEPAPSGAVIFTGAIIAAGEVDRFALRVAKGERVELRVIAAELGSPLDPVLEVRDAKGKLLVENDDGDSLDSRIRFTAQSEQVLSLAVRDLLGRGGADHVYRVEVGALADVARCRESITGRRGEDVGVAVPAGSRAATILLLEDVSKATGRRLAFDGLPEGVRAEVAPVIDGLSTVPVVFVADADRAPSVTSVGVELLGADGEAGISLAHRQPVPLLRTRNDLILLSTSLPALPIAVTAAAPFTVAVTAPKVPIVRGGSASLDVRLTRRANFRGTITVAPLWTPPGLSIATAALRPGTDEASLAISARSNAMLGEFPLVFIAVADDSGVARRVASEFVPLEVAEPWVGATLERATLEQGKSIPIAIPLAWNRPFAGSVTAEFVRLPKGLTVNFASIEPGAERVTGAIVAATDAALGRHRNLVLRLRLSDAAGEILHHVGGGEIRVDAPLVKTEDQ